MLLASTLTFSLPLQKSKNDLKDRGKADRVLKKQVLKKQEALVMIINIDINHYYFRFLGNSKCRKYLFIMLLDVFFTLFSAWN